MALLSAMVPLHPRTSSTHFFTGPSLSVLPPRPQCSSAHPRPLGYAKLAKKQYIRKKAWCISATERELQGQNNSDSVNGSYLDHYGSDNLVVYLLKSFLSDIKGFLQFLWEQPSGLKYIEFPSIQSAIKDQLGSYRRKEGIFGWPSAQADRTQTSASTWWEDYGADTPELQSLAIRILSQGCSSSSVERLWSTFGHITPKKRNRLGVTKANDLVFVNANKRLLRKMSFELSKERFIGLENPLPTNSDNEEAKDFPDSHVEDEDDVMDLPEGLDDDVIEPEAEPDFDHDDE